jgi:hypothetical protein
VVHQQSLAERFFRKGYGLDRFSRRFRHPGRTRSRVRPGRGSS